MLNGERDSYDREGAQQRAHQVDARDLDAHHHQPDRVNDDGEMAQVAFERLQAATERGEAERRELEALEPDGDADDRKAKDEPDERVREAHEDATGEEPQQVPEEGHAPVYPPPPRDIPALLARERSSRFSCRGVLGVKKPDVRREWMAVPSTIPTMCAPHEYRPSRGVIAALLMVAVVVIAACSATPSPGDARASSPRLVSLSPGVTATVVAIGGAHTLVAVSDYCELPEGSSIPRVGTALTVNLEKLASLKQGGALTVVGPKMQLAWSDSLKTLASLEVLPWSAPDELAASTRALGALVGERAAAEALANELERTLHTSPPADGARVALFLDSGEAFDGTFWFVKSNSIHGAALHAAGYRNAFPEATSGLPQVSAEQLIAADPDMILLVANRPLDEARRRRAVEGLRELTPLKASRTGAIGVMGYHGALVEGPGVVLFTRRLQESLGSLVGSATEGAM